MAIILPEGLFNGKRLRACSDTARLIWPYLFLASNGFGRLEIDYEFIIRNFFVDFRNPPKSSEFFGIIREYHENGLMFLYESDGVWGQWDCKPGSLQRYKTAKDRQSPAPDEKAFEEWKKTHSLKTKGLQNISEIFGKFPLGVGVGVGVGVGKNHSPSPAAPGVSDVEDPIPLEGRDRLFEVEPVERPRQNLEAQQSVWFAEWWPTVWRKVGKDGAWAKFRTKIRSPELFAKVMAQTAIQGPEFRRREQDKQPHPETWLSKGRYLDEEPVAASWKTSIDDTWEGED